MNDQTLGKIAFEACQCYHGYKRPWCEAPPSEQQSWDYIAQAVARAVSPLAFQAGDDE